MPISRRTFVLSAAALPLASAFAADDPGIAAIEATFGGRLGIAVLDTANGKRITHRANERFAMCSTFKFLLAAAILQRIATGTERADRIVHYGAQDMLFNSPITEAHQAEGGMRIDALCEAAITVSDNTAANLLIAALGGPQSVTAYARSLGDDTTRLDRIELALNEVPPGDPRDTTTPAAMLENLRRILIGDALPRDKRIALQGWMERSKPGANRLKAGLPPDWRIAHKPGTGFHDICNDIALVQPPGRKPILIAAYYAEGDGKEAVLAAVGKAITAQFG